MSRCAPVRPPQLDLLFSSSLRFNAANGLAGILLHTGDRFVQYIEGRREVVEALSERIGRDSRHSEVKTLFRMPRSPLFAGRAFVVEVNRSSYVGAIVRNAADSPTMTDDSLARMLRLLQEFVRTSS